MEETRNDQFPCGNSKSESAPRGEKLILFCFFLLQLNAISFFCVLLYYYRPFEMALQHFSKIGIAST